MITKEQVIREFLSDPLMLEKGYYTEGSPEKVKLTVKSDSKMVEFINLLVSSKFEEIDDTKGDAKITRTVNQFFNETD
jgi:hypothetical protein